MATTPSDPEVVREAVRDRYAAAARALTVLDLSGPACCTPANNDPLPEGVPPEAFAASLGCGNPTALATLQPGEAVLDLGSGGGLDALLAAKGVGPSGLVYGLDMTDEMLLLAEENRRKAGVQNVRLLKGYIEAVPLPDDCVDVVISNCVINLSTDKAQVLREAFRVLKPGGRLAVSDIVVQGDLPIEVRRDIEAWVGCVAGALTEEEYRRLLAEAGFEGTLVQVTRTYDPHDLAVRSGSGRVVSAFIGAWKAV